MMHADKVRKRRRVVVCCDLLTSCLSIMLLQVRYFSSVKGQHTGHILPKINIMYYG